MSSLVQAKWVSSATRGEAELGELAAYEVLDGLDVVAGGRLESRRARRSRAAPKSATNCAQRAGLLGARAARNRTYSWSVRYISHSTSTCTRARLSARLGEVVAEAATAARYRPSSGLSG